MIQLLLPAPFKQAGLWGVHVHNSTCVYKLTIRACYKYSLNTKALSIARNIIHLSIKHNYLIMTDCMLRRANTNPNQTSNITLSF